MRAVQFDRIYDFSQPKSERQSGEQTFSLDFHAGQNFAIEKEPRLGRFVP